MATATPQTLADTHAASHHPPHLQHHFVSSEQQFSAAKLGMWMFLITEILLFSGMFVAYAVYRTWYPEVFVGASKGLDPWMGGLNTLVLLTSSFTLALSINKAQHNKTKATAWLLVITVVLAGAFMVVKYFEYTSKFHGGVFPGIAFNPHGDHYGFLQDIPYATQFYSIYFVMTGIHGVHVLIGMAVISRMAYRAFRGDFSSSYYTPVEITGLYWHLVNIIWIFLFPLMYLI